MFIGRETTYETIGHAAVMIGYTNQDSSLKLNVRNSLAGQIVFKSILFDKKQPGEHEIEGKITKNMNEWNLAHENCYYFEFAWFDF